jgi:hypothetical protein
MVEPEVEQMTQAQIYEGTLDEIIARYGDELAGHHLKVFIDDTPADERGAATAFYELDTSDEWGEALRTWATNHDPSLPLLSDFRLFITRTQRQSSSFPRLQHPRQGPGRQHLQRTVWPTPYTVSSKGASVNFTEAPIVVAD